MALVEMGQAKQPRGQVMKIVKRTLGIILLAVPFATVTWLMFVIGGGIAVLVIYGTVGVFLGCITGGLYLLEWANEKG